MSETRVQKGRRQAAIFRVVNVPMRAILGLPFPTPLGNRLMLLHVTGRVTGKHYRQPVSYVREADALLTPGGGRWTRNLRDTEPVRIRLRGRDVSAEPELIRDHGEVQRLLALMAADNPRLKKFIPIPTTPSGQLDPSALAAAIDHGFCIVRWHLPAARPPQPR